MPPDEKPPGPDYFSTKQIPKVEVPQNTLDAVLSEVRAMRAETTERLTTQANAIGELGERIVKVEGRIDTLEGARTANSMKVRGISENDLAQESKIAERIIKETAFENRLDRYEKKVDTIEKKTDAQTNIMGDLKDLIEEVKALLKSPVVKLVVGIVLGILGFLATHGVKPL